MLGGGSSAPPPQMTRRDFLKRVGGAAVAASLPGTPSPSAPAPLPPKMASQLSGDVLSGFELPGGWQINGFQGQTSGKPWAEWDVSPNPDMLDGSEWISDLMGGVDPAEGGYVGEGVKQFSYPVQWLESMKRPDMERLKDLSDSAAKAFPKEVHEGLTYRFNTITGQWHPVTQAKWQHPSAPQFNYWSSDGVVPRQAIVDHHSRIAPIDPLERAKYIDSFQHPVVPAARANPGEGIEELLSEFNQVKRAQMTAQLRNPRQRHLNREDFNRELREFEMAPGGRADQQPVMDIDPGPYRRGTLDKRWGRLPAVPFERVGKGTFLAAPIGAALLSGQEENR